MFFFKESGVLVAWGDPPSIPMANHYDPLNSERGKSDELKMQLKFMFPLLIFLGSFKTVFALKEATLHSMK